METRFAVDLRMVMCASCGIPFGITTDFEDRRRDDHAGFKCPAGHGNAFHGKSEAERLRDKLAAVQGQLDQTHAKLEDARKQTAAERKRTAAAKGALTRASKRAAAGVCLHCNRTFQNVARHVASKHPEHVHEATEAPAHAKP